MQSRLSAPHKKRHVVTKFRSEAAREISVPDASHPLRPGVSVSARASVSGPT